MIWFELSEERVLSIFDFVFCISWTKGFVLECWSAGMPGSGGYLVFVGLGVVLLVFARCVLLFRLTMRCETKIVAS
jgi:hypothetical protein